MCMQGHSLNALHQRFGIADRVLDVDADDFDMRCPIDGLNEQPLLSFNEITDASVFVSKFPSLAEFVNLSIKAGRTKVLKTEAQAHGLTVDDIAMIFLCVIVCAHLLRQAANLFNAGTPWSARSIVS
jgi:hypothetical protein